MASSLLRQYIVPFLDLVKNRLLAFNNNSGAKIAKTFDGIDVRPT